MKSVNLKKAVLLSCSVLMIAGLGSACKEKPKVQIAPEEKLPISLTLSQEEFSVMVEETVKIPVSVKNATEAVAFTSTNPSVATVDNNGVVTGLAEGETEIIISVEGVTDSCLVIVTKNIYVPYIAVGNIETNEMNLLKGGNFTLQSVVKKGQNVLTAPISYSSADTSIAEISQEGVITAKNYGTTTIMLTSTYQGLSFEYSVIVNVCRDIIIQSPVESIQLYTNNSLGGLMEYNISNVQITEDGRALATDYEVLSMDEGVVSVSDKTLTMVAVGETQVVLRCTIDNIHYEKYLNVSVNNPQLATVDNFVLTGTDLTWDAVEGAAYYTVYDGDKQNDTLQPTYDLSEAYGAGMVTVVAHPLGNDILSSKGGRFQYNIDHINLLDRALQRTYVEYTSMQAVTEEDYTEDGAIYLVKLGNSNLCSPTYGYTFKKVYTSPAFAEKVDWGTGNLVDTSKLSFDYATSSVSMWVYTYTETTFYYVSMKSSFARTMQSFVTVPAHQWTKIDFPVVLDACAYITAETTEFFVTDMKLYSTGYQDNNYATLPYNYATVVQEYIDALPEKGMATIEYTDDIREARKQYEYLNDALKEKIVGLDKLESAELQIVNDLIATLDTNSLTSKDFENIAKALKLYNDTPDYLKEQVDYTVLRTAEANIVDACIAEIPELDKLTIKDGDKVFYAKQVYDSISEEAKGQVQNLSKLNALETQIVQLYIDALPQENDVEMLDMEAIINAQYFVTKLSEEQKATLENLSKIEKAVARLQSMSKVLYSMESLTGLKKSSNFPGSNCYDIKTATDTRYGNVLEIDLHTLPTAGDGHIAIQYENQENFAQILEGCSYVYVSIYNGSEMDMTCYADFGGSTNLSYAMLEAQGWTLLEIPVADFMSGTYFGILNSKLGSTPATYKISAIFTTETRYQGVVRMIENLPDPSTITAFDYAQIVKAEEAYKNLSNEMKAQVSNYQTLLDVRAAYDKKFVVVEGMMNATAFSRGDNPYKWSGGNIGIVKDAEYGNVLNAVYNRGAINAAITYYLPANAATLLDGLDVVEFYVYNGSKKDQQLLANFGGTVNMAYATLQAEAWTKVTVPTADFLKCTYIGIANAKDSTDTFVEFKFSMFYAAIPGEEAFALKVDEKIQALSTYTELDIDFISAVVEARAAYEALTTNGKALVTKYNDLLTYESKFMSVFAMENTDGLEVYDDADMTLSTVKDADYGNCLQMDYTFTQGITRALVSYTVSQEMKEKLANYTTIAFYVYNDYSTNKYFYSDFGGDAGRGDSMTKGEWTKIEVSVEDFLAGSYFGIDVARQNSVCLISMIYAY